MSLKFKHCLLGNEIQNKDRVSLKKKNRYIKMKVITTSQKNNHKDNEILKRSANTHIREKN